MESRSRRLLTALVLPWLLPLCLGPRPLFAMGEPPPRPAEIPLEVPVGDLGQNDRLPEPLRSRYRPAPVGVYPVHQAGALGYPLPLQPAEQAPFGWRLAEARNAWRLHTGLDLIAPEGTPVFAVLPGTVRLVDEVGGYGLLVVVDHGLGWQSLYGHLLEVSVLPGESLAAGQPIGRVGSSGSATTAHLHFEWRQRRQGRLVAVDPSPLLQPIGTGPSVAGRAPLPPRP
jgi:murein DD-endopeptidase MepM/ murein hydrolase activator NlpD